MTMWQMRQSLSETTILLQEVAEKAIPECNITFIAGNDMKAKLSDYLGILFEQNPAKQSVEHYQMMISTTTQTRKKNKIKL